MNKLFKELHLASDELSIVLEASYPGPGPAAGGTESTRPLLQSAELCDSGRAALGDWRGEGESSEVGTGDRSNM